jgi:hypothetical protein
MAIVTLCCQSQDIVINEVAYSNNKLIKDFRGDYPDWFELYNNSLQPVNLEGYKVTDDTSKMEFWEFPHFILNPGEFIVVFASDKDTVHKAEFHTSFRLAGMKETLFLFGPDDQIVDYFLPVCVPFNKSRACIPDGSPIRAVTEPTPGISNNNSIPEAVNYKIDTLNISTESGFYDDKVSIVLQKKQPENEIRYTLNGDIPDEQSLLYSDPLQLHDLTPENIRFANIPETIKEPGDQIFKANILRAVVYSNGCPASNEIVNTYFINKDIRYPVPVVSLITEEDNLFNEETGIYVHGKYGNFDQHGEAWERPVHVEIFNTVGTQVVDQDAGMRVHGRGSRKSPQKSLRLYAGSEYGDDHFDYPFFSQKPNLNSFRVLLLRTTGGTLGPLFKEELCNSLVMNMNLDYPAGETAILFINGEYWGIYNLMERQNSFFVENNYAITDARVDIVAYDRKLVIEEGTLEEYNNLIHYIETADPGSSGFYEEMNKRLDLDNLIDYYSAQVYFANFDWPFSNVELWKLSNDTARWRYFFFDSDASMIWLNDDHITGYNNSMEDYQRSPEFCTIILRTMLKNEQFRANFTKRLTWHLSNTFNPGRVLGEIEKFRSKYSPLVPEHIYRWYNPVDYNKWDENVQWLQTFAIQRPVKLAQQIQKNFGGIEINPNPSNGHFMLKFFNPPESLTVKIFSLNGVLVEEESFTGIQTSVPLTINLPSGIYILHAQSGTSFYSEKLVIQ